jgi:hypothetical protein
MHVLCEISQWNPFVQLSFTNKNKVRKYKENLEIIFKIMTYRYGNFSALSGLKLLRDH